MIASAETTDRQQGKATICGGLAEADGQPLLQALAQGLVPHDPATDTVAHQDHVPAYGSSEDQIVERSDRVQCLGGHVQQLRDVLHALIGHPAPVPLHYLQGLQAQGLPVWITRKFGLDFLSLSGAQHGSLTQRSTPAMTKSILPRM